MSSAGNNEVRGPPDVLNVNGLLQTNVMPAGALV